MKTGIKHFLVVGVAFAFLGGWVTTIVVNTALGMLLQVVLRQPPTDFYFGSAFLTAVSLALITSCELVGNRVYRKRFGPTPLGSAPLWLSTGLFTALVLVYVGPEVSRTITGLSSNTSYFYRNPGQLALVLSLPLARLLLMPAIHFTAARLTLSREGVT